MPSKPDFQISPEAIDDIRDILQVSQEQWGVDSRLRMQMQFEEVFARIKRHPMSGTSIDSFRLGYRKKLMKPYVIFYRVTEMELRIVRVIHSRRDVTEILERTEQH